MLNFFDKLEDKVRAVLSRAPIMYALIAGVGVVLFWRGVWHTADMLVFVYVNWVPDNGVALEGTLWWDGPLSIIIGAIILLITGTFVSEFIGKEIIISGLRGEKKLTEKTEKELRTEISAIAEIREHVREMNELLTSKSKPKNGKR